MTLMTASRFPEDVMASRIVIVDDEADIRGLVADILGDEGYQTVAVADEAQTRAQLAEAPADLVVLDLWLKDDRQGGMKILEHLRRESPDTPVIIISGHGTIETAIEAVRKGAYDFIEKPFKSETLLLKVRRAMETSALRRELHSLRSKISEEIVLAGSSPFIQEARNVMDKVAPTTSRVLLRGEAGVGKEFFARRIHSLSPRAERPFIVARCAALSVDRFDAQFFGDSESSPGFLQQAEKGTLYLDEIGDLSLDVQGKLMYILHDEGEGAERDIRIISSTRHDLSGHVKKSILREDIFFLLHVVPVDIASLRERREDIPVLIDKAMRACVRTEGLNPHHIDDLAMRTLVHYDWPGNIRQLRNVVDWLLIMSSRDRELDITMAMLPPEIRDGQEDDPSIEIERWMDIPLREARQRFEKDYLMFQITRYDHNIARVARRIGMDRTALHRKIKTLGLSLEKSAFSEKEDR